MEYFTTPEQEEHFRARYQERLAAEQDRIRGHRERISPCLALQEEDRYFFVEGGITYLGEVKPGAETPLVPIEGGARYEVDPLFLHDVQRFVQRHSQYMIVFQMRRGYSRRGGVYPARMVAEEEELFLEDVCYHS